jgi:hypothetical protein
MKFRLLMSALMCLASASPALCNKKPEQTCKVNFAFVYVDRLNNTNRGIEGKNLKSVQDKLSKYGDVCYTADENAADYVFFVHTTPAVYHGVHTYSNTSSHTDSNPVSGTITDQSGNTSTFNGTENTTTTTTSTSSVPYEVDYSVFILDILIPVKNGTDQTPKVLRTFDQKGLYNTMYGIGYGKGKHPIPNVVDAAAKWLHENNLGQSASR